MPAPIQLYNSLSNQLEALHTREEGKVAMYVCGMTVYDYCHIGHARAMLTFDLVVRHLRHRGYEVNYVRNHTDVDDKIIARANEKGQPPLELAQFFIDALDEDLEALGTVKPDHEPRVSEHIENIISMNQTLVERGHAYEANGSVYFAVESFPAYGELSGKRLKDLIAGERVAVDPEKRSPADFALWKAAKPGECSWDSPWGKGRPGWHIECSAMSHHHPGNRLRHPRWGHRPDFSPSRKRSGPVHLRDRRKFRPLLDAQRTPLLWHREDVEVSRQHCSHSRHCGAGPRRGPAALVF